MVAEQDKQLTFAWLAASYWQVAHPDGQEVQILLEWELGLLVNPVVHVWHSMAAEVELYEQTSHPVPQLVHCPAVAPKLYPVLQALQVIAPLLEERVHVAQLEIAQESHDTLVESFIPYAVSHTEQLVTPVEASREQVWQKGGQTEQDPLSSL